MIKMIALILPGIQKKQADTRDRIVSILTEYWPLTTKSIYAIITRQGQDITYQAVHKNIKQLLEQGIVVQHKRKYYLNAQWVEEIKKFVLGFEQNYANPNKENELTKEEKIMQALDKEEITKKQPQG
ncbi:MAG: hypothetical protein JW772_04820 [Candidatus Diapherotrites archaeon]|nr:hypothetical protein [Candidatus Diapherotrites archaeon]